MVLQNPKASTTGYQRLKAMLNDSELRALKPKEKRYACGDGKGLAIEVYPSGGMAWRYRYQLNGKTEKICLGKYPTVTLKAARALRKEAEALVKAGQSPAQAKQAGKVPDRRSVSKPSAPTLKAVGDQYLAQLASRGKATAGIHRYLERDLYPALGDRPLASITKEDVAAIVASKASHPATCLALRGILKRIFDLALREELISKNPALSVVVPAPVSRDRHLSPSELRLFLAALEKADSDPALKAGLRLILLTLVRKNELLSARWSEVDFDEAIWTIPAVRTKNGKAHTVYLSAQAIALFRELQALATGSEFVFPDPSRTKPRSHNALNRALNALIAAVGMQPFTVHDLRRTGATLLHENGYHSDIVEKALNHTIPGVRGVYNRAAYATQRRDMLQFWANYLDQQADGKVIFGRFKETR